MVLSGKVVDTHALLQTVWVGLAAGADCDLLVFGHTHKPWVRDCLRQEKCDVLAVA
jgi:predicted phosphodiesterase